MSEKSLIEKMREFFEKEKSRPFSIDEPFCGPFHPDFVDELKKQDLRCPCCGTKARRHK